MHRCSRCKQSTYCSRECQVADWHVHKNMCSTIALHSKLPVSEKVKARERALEEASRARITIVNPRRDRSIPTHANDTHQTRTRTSALNALIKRMKLRNATVYLTRVDPRYKGTFGRCAWNVAQLVDRYGGRAVRGWTLWQGAYVVEAEAHVVWKPRDDDQCVFNVTPYNDGTLYTSLFVEEHWESVDNHTPNSVMMWYR